MSVLSPSRRRAALAALALVTASGACHGGTTADAPRPSLGGPAADSVAIRRDIAYLASDALEGRGTGTPGNDSAAAYLARRYAALGLQPAAQLVGDSARCDGARVVIAARLGGRDVDRSRCRSFLQPFVARAAAAAHAGLPSALPTQNVVALLPGSDSVLRHQYVIVGAHFDHLGRSTAGALDPEARDAIRNGADDNASGTAAVLELARLLARQPARRSVLFVNFSGEELGVLGSQYFIDHPPVPLDSVQAMLNFDMVGRLRDSKLIVYGVGTAAELPGIVRWAGSNLDLKVTTLADGFGPSDHASFAAKGIPVLHFFTDLHDDYHRAGDDVEKIDAGGEARVVTMAERAVRALGDRLPRLTVTPSPVASRAAGSRASSNVYLGSVPDMSASETSGLRLSGVRPGSPADRAGLLAGDLVVELAGTPVKDLYTYSDALYSHKPGETVEIVVVRGGERRTLRATLGRRGE